MFEPPIHEFCTSTSNQQYTVICGANNSGKSYVLKAIKRHLGISAYLVGASRFYNLITLPSAQPNPNDLVQMESQFRDQLTQTNIAHEENAYNLTQIMIQLTDLQHKQLFELCEELLGYRFEIVPTDSSRQNLGQKFVAVDGQPLSINSTGTRLLVTLLGICFDNRFTTILIDEPELGLSPSLQATLASLLSNAEKRKAHFPHIERIIVASHSHVFLDRTHLEHNFKITRNAEHIALTATETRDKFHQLQFGLLGNSLEALYFPSAIVVVEGELDKSYLERVFHFRFPEEWNIAVSHSDGDPRIPKRVEAIGNALGGLLNSPYRHRLFVVLDQQNSVNKEWLIRIGVLEDNIVIWDRNGIEHLYPPSIMENVTGWPARQLGQLEIRGQIVELPGSEAKWPKVELNKKVLSQYLGDEIELPQEIETKLLSRIRNAINIV